MRTSHLPLALLAALTACRSPTPAVEKPRYGALMVEVGHRFELLGRAAVARRFDLAIFELHEMREVLEEDLPNAAPPKVPTQVDLTAMSKAFLAAHPAEIESALVRRDEAALAIAFAKAAKTCNACHEATGHRYIEIPERPGDVVPRLDPIGPAMPAAPTDGGEPTAPVR